MKIFTNSFNCPSYFTRGKRYELTNILHEGEPSCSGTVVADNGAQIIVCLEASSHIRFDDWEIDTMTTTLKAGDKVQYPDDKSLIGVVIDHPLVPGKLLAVMPGFTTGYHNCHDVDVDGSGIIVLAVDSLKESWDKLDEPVQSAIQYLLQDNNRKIAAIRLLRSIDPSLSLTDAKTIVETYA